MEQRRLLRDSLFNVSARVLTAAFGLMLAFGLDLRESIAPGRLVRQA